MNGFSSRTLPYASDVVNRSGTSGAAVVGIDVGGTKTNATVLDESRAVPRRPDGRDPEPGDRGTRRRPRRDRRRRWSSPSPSPARATDVCGRSGSTRPGPASADGVISSRGATNFAEPVWWGFDFRAAVEAALGLPVIYNNDGNAAALYAHHAALRRGRRRALVGLGHRRHRARRRRHRVAATSSGARPAWPASSGTCTSRWTACSSQASPCRAATAVSPATSRASPR